MDPQEASQFEGWWRQIEPALRRVMARMSGTGAFDTVQDVAVLALRNWSRFESYEDFARWCHIRARWLALDELARARRHPEVPIESVDLQISAKDSSALAEIMPLVEGLPNRQREVVVYRLMGYRTDEIARIMSVTESAVRSHWRYAQHTLSKMVEP